jgi:hypothetical protein
MSYGTQFSYGYERSISTWQTLQLTSGSSASWETNSRLAIAHIIQNPKNHYRIWNNPPLDPTLSQFKTWAADNLFVLSRPVTCALIVFTVKQTSTEASFKVFCTNNSLCRSHVHQPSCQNIKTPNQLHIFRLHFRLKLYRNISRKTNVPSEGFNVDPKIGYNDFSFQCIFSLKLSKYWYST